jgi:hypothetical protein
MLYHHRFSALLKNMPGNPGGTEIKWDTSEIYDIKKKFNNQEECNI